MCTTCPLLFCISVAVISDLHSVHLQIFLSWFSLMENIISITAPFKADYSPNKAQKAVSYEKDTSGNRVNRAWHDVVMIIYFVNIQYVQMSGVS